MPFFCSSSSVSSGIRAPQSREGGSGPGRKPRSAPRSRTVSGQETLTLFTAFTSSAIRRACPLLFAQHRTGPASPPAKGRSPGFSWWPQHRAPHALEPKRGAPVLEPMSELLLIDCQTVRRYTPPRFSKSGRQRTIKITFPVKGAGGGRG